jgi:hypothetical protein
MATKANWIGTQSIWNPQQFTSGIDGMSAIYNYRRKRLPWNKATHLKVAVQGQRLMIFRGPQPVPRVNPKDALLVLEPQDLTLRQLSEYFNWPDIEAIHFGYTGIDLSSYNSPMWAADGILKIFHAEPMLGWWPIHRGALGVSFLRNVMEDSHCVEVNTECMRLYRGPIAENETLRDHRVTNRWSLEQMEVNAIQNVIPDVDEVVRCRLMMRRLRLALFTFNLANELPF